MTGCGADGNASLVHIEDILGQGLGLVHLSLELSEPIAEQLGSHTIDATSLPRHGPPTLTRPKGRTRIAWRRVVPKSEVGTSFGSREL